MTNIVQPSRPFPTPYYLRRMSQWLKRVPWVSIGKGIFYTIIWFAGLMLFLNVLPRTLAHLLGF